MLGAADGWWSDQVEAEMDVGCSSVVLMRECECTRLLNCDRELVKSRHRTGTFFFARQSCEQLQIGGGVVSPRGKGKWEFTKRKETT